jgi:rubrerythrin
VKSETSRATPDHPPIHTRTTAQCVHSAIALELRAGALYAGLAARFDSLPWFRDLLLGLSAEEEQHATRMRMLERVARRALWTQADLDRHAGALEAAHARLREFQEALSGPSAAVPAAVCDAILALEETFEALHAEMMATTLAPEVSALFMGLAAQDGHHRELLRSAASRLRVPGPVAPS